jgi:hypothetical protein
MVYFRPAAMAFEVLVITVIVPILADFFSNLHGFNCFAAAQFIQ